MANAVITSLSTALLWWWEARSHTLPTFLLILLLLLRQTSEHRPHDHQLQGNCRYEFHLTRWQRIPLTLTNAHCPDIQLSAPTTPSTQLSSDFGSGGGKRIKAHANDDDDLTVSMNSMSEECVFNKWLVYGEKPRTRRCVAEVWARVSLAGEGKRLVGWFK